MKQGAFQRTIPCEESGVIKMHNELRFPVHNNNNEVSGLGCIAIEVSDEKFATNTLTRAGSLAQLGSWRWSITESCLISCSQEFANILGCSISDTFDLMHHRLNRLIHPDDHEIVKPIIDKMSGQHHQAYKLEYRIIKRNGDIRHVVEIAEPVFNGDKAVEYAGILQDITERKTIENELNDIKEKLEHLVEQRTEHLEYLASHDSLTGLYNRSALNNEVERNLPIAQGSHAALVLLDLDGFKDINDYFGHLVGDKTLKIIAERIKAACNKNDFAIRLGGDEFAVVMLNLDTPLTTVPEFCEKLIETVIKTIKIAQVELYVRCSIGYEISDHNLISFDNILANADLALYEAKKNQEVKFLKYDYSMGEDLSFRNELETELRQAISNKKLHVEYQPKYSLGSESSVIGVEALIRWNDKTLGNIAPDIFIPIAEKSGLINDIGDFVLNKSCQDIARINKELNLNLTVSVNCSAAQFYDKDLSKKIRNAITKNSFSESQLEVEITESLLIKNFAQTTSMLNKIRDMGVKVSLDDFGTGYSSLSYLKDYQVDTIKLDKEFIQNLADSKNSQHIVKSVVDLAKNLELSVICECIETEEQKELIEKAGCQYGQGFLLGKPMPISQLSELLKS